MTNRAAVSVSIAQTPPNVLVFNGLLEKRLISCIHRMFRRGRFQIGQPSEEEIAIGVGGHSALANSTRRAGGPSTDCFAEDEWSDLFFSRPRVRRLDECHGPVALGELPRGSRVRRVDV